MELLPDALSRGKIAIICGAVSAGVFISHSVRGRLGVDALGLGLMCSGIGILFALRSLATKEKKHSLAVAAIIVSAAGPVCLATALLWEAYQLPWSDF
jgi:tRNA pseudouridine-54 N-methylase